MKNENAVEILANELKQRNNPTDLKSAIIGKVVQLEPVIVQIENGLVLLTENDELEISEWFRFRCNIDKTGVLSSNVPSDTDNAESISEVHSYGGAACQMPSAISYLASAILDIKNELLALKCDLKIGDFVVVASLEETDKYILLDKVL